MFPMDLNKKRKKIKDVAVAHVEVIVFENIINTFFLYTFLAGPGAVFPEFNGGVFANGIKFRRSRRCVNQNLP